MKLDFTAKLVAAFTIYRQGFHQGAMGYIVGTSKAAAQCAFLDWVTLLAILFNELESI